MAKLNIEKKQDISTVNSKGDFHGYQLRYDNQETGKLLVRCFYKYGSFYGYIESHDWESTRFHIR